MTLHHGRCILALDQGTTGTTALVVDARGQIVGRGYKEIQQYYPQPGWVEHDPAEIWRSCQEAASTAKMVAGISDADIAGIGISNQRETTILWDARTGAPVGRAIVWQCRRTAGLCDSLLDAGHEQFIRVKTGLVIDAYFSGTKLRWLLDQSPEVRARAEQGDLRFGTIDSWLIWNLTGGRVHATDYSNASRTMLFNIYEQQWDSDLLELLDIPSAVLPRVVASSGIVGETVASGAIGAGIPIGGVAGDQQAALFGQACYQPGMVKATYGTGSFLVMNTGEHGVRSERGLLTTLAWSIDGRVEYALEGSIFIAGAAIQWLRDGLGLIQSAAETEALARSVSDTGGVYLVPAFVGMGAPYWDMYARGTIVGITRGTGRAHLVRAALEAIAYQTRDVVDLMASEATLPIAELRVDGGAAANDFLCQFQADLLGAPVVRPWITETTGLGAAYLAGLAVGLWRTREELAAIWRENRRFTPTMDQAKRAHLYRGWQRAVERALRWME